GANHFSSLLISQFQPVTIMKTSLIVRLLFSIAVNIQAQTAVPGQANGVSQGITNIKPKDTPNTVISRDANSRVWERTTYEQGPSGAVIPRVHRYTELATGLHYLKNGEWLESKEEVTVSPHGGGEAVQGQHQVYFPYDIYDGFVELVTPDGGASKEPAPWC